MSGAAAGADGAISGRATLETQMEQVLWVGREGDKRRKVKGERTHRNSTGSCIAMYPGILTETVAAARSECKKPKVYEAHVLATAVLAAAAAEVGDHTEFHLECTQEPGTRDLVTLEVFEGSSIDLRAAVDVAGSSVARVESRVHYVEVNLFASRPPANVLQLLYARHVEPEGGLWGHRECRRGRTSWPS
ncbi:hypothetical protein B0H16DRAFT_1474970 [Mycena metata]|uniref:Uncharacterized protein n=1 Tax=Mycena metata TaxID=1033252 RepID=A0AAD7MIN7_9AGAR|nr:hypothetical protein B0H16DRAFT_1474970 [Mycena metata]